jgi:hypothetical protein
VIHAAPRSRIRVSNARASGASIDDERGAGD